MSERAVHRMLALALGTAVAALLWAGLLLREARTAGPAPADGGPARAEIVAGLVAESAGIWDTHPDPDVGRVLQPGLVERSAGHIRVSSNAQGWREREIDTPKPEGRRRVVLLGDSFVFGNGVAAEVRAGVILEQALRSRAGLDVDVLHVGLTDWNLVAECSYLRRQLATLEPDLVVQVLIANDLDDPSTARGFGALAAWSTQAPGHVDGMLATRHAFALGFGRASRASSLLNAGLDFESCQRFAQAREALLALESAQRARGGAYLALLNWPEMAPVAREQLLDALPEASRAHVPRRVHDDPALRVSPTDAHWSAAGMDAVARHLYALIRQRGLLRGAELPPWPEAESLSAGWEAAGAAEAAGRFDLAAWTGGEALLAALDLTRLDGAMAEQIHGGVDAQGRVSPYGSLLLARPDGATELVLDLEFDGAATLNGTTRVFVDEVTVAEVPMATSGGFQRLRLPLPAAVAGRSHLSVRLHSDDWAYLPPDARRCVSLRLLRAALR